jgi:Zn-dependent peptidase ImmA (M78 family)
VPGDSLSLEHLTDYYRVYPDLIPLRETIAAIMNEIVRMEKGPVSVADVWIVPESAYLGRYFGTTILTKDGDVVLRIAVKRALDEVADTLLHELSHILLGKRHIRKINHGPHFTKLYEYLKQHYTDFVLAQLR